VASHKFLPLIYQLAARMSNSQDHFQSTLQEVSVTIDYNMIENMPHSYTCMSLVLNSIVIFLGLQTRHFIILSL